MGIRSLIIFIPVLITTNILTYRIVSTRQMFFPANTVNFNVDNKTRIQPENCPSSVSYGAAVFGTSGNLAGSIKILVDSIDNHPNHTKGERQSIKKAVTTIDCAYAEFHDFDRESLHGGFHYDIHPKLVKAIDLAESATPFFEVNYPAESDRFLAKTRLGLAQDAIQIYRDLFYINATGNVE